MRTLLGALVGLGLGSLLMAVLISQGIQSFWPILPVGLIAGLTVRSFSKNSRGGYVGGGLAAIVTVVALVTGPLLATKIIAMQTPKTPPKNDVVAVVTETTDEEGNVVATAVEEPIAIPVKSDVPGQMRYSTQMNQKFPVADAICLAIGCLIAYEIGKGKAEKAEIEEDSSDDTPADDTAPTEEA